MVCPNCGASFEGPGNFCPHCGAPVAFAAAPGQGVPPPPAYGYSAPSPGYGMPPYGASQLMRVQRHLQILAVLWGCFAVYRLLAGLAGMFFLRMWSHGGGFGHRFPFPQSQIPFLSAMLPFTLITTLFLVVLSGLVAYGMLQRRPWGRTMSIVMSILSMLKFPVGTALGIYTLWVMAPAVSAMEYEAIADRTQPGF